ncbi:DUF1501 domain-containing protein, partial [Pirellulales bacterium]|nr:DUF1501 domain-containing protein [Pirellulales bacterium]
RQMLGRFCAGFGGIAASAMLAELAAADAVNNPLAARPPQRLARAKRIIFLFMQGGPSHIDTFDYKPQLQKDDGKPPPFERTRVQFADRGNLMGSPWKFRQTGESGIWMSSLWQHLPQVADELCMIHSVCETNVAHGGATMKLHTGEEALVRPSMGAWISYGLGTENQNLPGFVTICPSSIHGGVNNYGSAFLPAVHQGVPLGTPGYPNIKARDAQFRFAEPRRSMAQQRRQLELLHELSRDQAARQGPDAEMEARLQSFELAFRMQAAAPEVLDIRDEGKQTRSLYGLDEEPTADFGLQCLLARRFAERGVRFIQVNHAHSLGFNNEQWDQHSHLKKGHEINAAQVDKPITALLLDLKARGLLEDTLVWWGGEFGRTPTIEVAANADAVGRDHHTDGFTMWLAGGGVRGGMRYGRTDEYGYYAIENRCTIHDLHATLLHILGLDHEDLTYEYAGRDFRLTDVFGNVAHEMLS